MNAGADDRGQLELAARFALERVSDGGILLDLETGSYYQVNTSAAEICGALLDELDMERARTRIVERMGVSTSEAVAMIDSIRKGLARGVASGEVAGPFRYGPSGAAFGLDEDGRRVLIVDPQTRRVNLADPERALRYAMVDYVRTITPKLLGLLGFTVLHASACRLEHGVIGFSGQSGAGKTTTMRAFASAGGTALSEDLLVLRDDGFVPIFWLGGETAAHAWAEKAADALASRRETAVSFADLAKVGGGEVDRLDELWFLDADRRVGDTLVRRPLAPAEGLLTLLRNTFLGVADGASWRRHLRLIRGLAQELRLVEVSPPNGLERLRDVARSYTTNSAS